MVTLIAVPDKPRDDGMFDTQTIQEKDQQLDELKEQLYDGKKVLRKPKLVRST